jgi:hypothetical protein
MVKMGLLSSLYSHCFFANWHKCLMLRSKTL